ncbi:cytochrome c maturation protein CcmE [Alphaproteobacteria bacterium]|nr:cytochrome c maturation protein CcmE [Alphaproteobacteria bacterium]|tara:strand:- start:64 stop:522 length:459 start_codon:yes stop_codon:yes gene_type:complete
MLKPKRRRLLFVVTGLFTLSLSSGLVLFAISDYVDLFLLPSGVYEKKITPNTNFKLGGLVEIGSISKSDKGLTTNFKVTDNISTLNVKYTGILPNLFREGQGVVAEGALNKDGVFIAKNLLAKHDENYLPPEIADKLKENGNWKGAYQKDDR